jgi:hypothetical protein
VSDEEEDYRGFVEVKSRMRPGGELMTELVPCASVRGTAMMGRIATTGEFGIGRRLLAEKSALEDPRWTGTYPGPGAPIISSATKGWKPKRW